MGFAAGRPDAHGLARTIPGRTMLVLATVFAILAMPFAPGPVRALAATDPCAPVLNAVACENS